MARPIIRSMKYHVPRAPHQRLSNSALSSYIQLPAVDERMTETVMLKES
jgi:hypothetical protein